MKLEDIQKYKELNSKLKALKEEYKEYIFLYITFSEDESSYIVLTLPQKQNLLLNKSSRLINTNSNFVSFDIREIDYRTKWVFKHNIRIFDKQYKNEITLLIDTVNNMSENDEEYSTGKKEHLNQIKLFIVNKFLNQDEKIQYNDLSNKISSYRNVYITSDLHFWHSNILKFELNRLKLVKTNMHDYLIKAIYNKLDEISEFPENKDVSAEDLVNRYYDDFYAKYSKEYYEEVIKEHNESLIENYNSVVNKDDLCIIVGDFSFGDVVQTEEILHQLNGDKLLIRGNHDVFLNNIYFNRDLFIDIRNYLEFKFNEQEVVLFHYPILHFKHQDVENGSVHLYGHIHSANIYKPFRSYHIGVDTNNYKPILLQDAIMKAKNENTNSVRYER